MKRESGSRKFGRRRKSSVASRRLLVERLEVRLAPALLVPGADAAAEARYYATTDGPYQVSDPSQATAAAAVGPILGSFQTSAHADAQASGALVSLARAGGADASTTPPTDTLAHSSSQGVGNWIVSGNFIRGEPLPVDVTLTVSGALQSSLADPLINQNDLRTSVAAQLLLASDFAPDQLLFNASAVLGTQISVTQLSVTGPWTFFTNTGFGPIRYDTSYSATIPITVEALEPFSLSASLETEAATAFTFEWFSTADFETAGGLTYTLSTSRPGATIVPVGGGGAVDGTVWHDVNGNEVEDPTELRLAGFRVFLDANQNGVFDAASEHAGLTNANGVYTIPNVPPGVYDVRPELPTGWEQTSPLDTSGNPIGDRVQVLDGATSTSRPFGAREIAADLGITLSDLPDPVTVGQLLTYTFNVTNHGPHTATGATVTATLDPNVMFVAPTVGGPPCSETGGVVTCQLSFFFASGASTSFSIDVVPLTAGTLSTTATVTSTTADPNGGNDSATAITTVDAEPPTDYTFRSVEQITGPFFVFPPSINDQGTVAYVTRLVGSAVDTILVADGGGSTAVLNSAVAFPPPAQGTLSFGFNPRINNAGTVAFSVANHDGAAVLETGIFTVDASSGLTAIRPLAGPPDFIATDDINNNGTVAFYEETLTGSSLIRTSSGGQFSTVVDSAGAQFNDVRSWTSINDAGTVAFVGLPAGGGEGVYTFDGTVTTPIVDFSDPSPGIAWANFFEPSIHDSGTVAFSGDFLVAGQPVPEQGVFTSNGATLTPIADSTGPFSFFDSPVLQDTGTVFFRAGLDAGGHGIFTGPDPATDKIIATGDSLLGSTVTFVTFQQGGTNSAGQIAFQVSLADGRNLIVVADPDNDSDGVPDTVEDAAPNGGDGDGVGGLDRDQGNVASIPNAVDGGYLTVVSPVGMQLVDVRVEANPDAANSPAGVQFPFGFVHFTVEGVSSVAPIPVQIIVHGAATISAYYKYGPTPATPTDHFYTFPGAQVAGNTITLLLIDGQTGDADLMANGQIVDPGGPAVIVQPMLDVSGPATGVRGQPLEFQFRVNPPGDYTYNIDWDGDGVVDESLLGSESLTAEHVYPGEGDYRVIVTATDATTDAFDETAHAVSIDAAAVIDGNLVVGGTTGDDRITFQRQRDDVLVVINGERIGPYSLDNDGRLIAYGQEGDDHISTSLLLLKNDAEFYGGPGDDRLIGGPGIDLLDGGDGDDSLLAALGNNILIGGVGHDKLVAGLGRSLLIGGAGSDRLFGVVGQNILIGGTTAYDNDHQSLRAILAQWTLPLPYATRVERLRDASRPVYLEKDETVMDDDEVDWLFGGLGQDWFFFDPSRDKLLGRRHGVAVN